MRRIFLLVAILALTVAAIGSAGAVGNGRHFVAHLSADEEVMPPGVVNDSQAQGQAIFRLDRSGESLSYKLIVANIENVMMAHIHCGASGVNGPVAVWLFPVGGPPPLAPGGGRVDGVIATGTITDAQVLALADSPACPGGIADFEDLLDKLRSGGAYVNVHTNDGEGDVNTGPGDFPGGEIRGQIR